MLVEDTTAFVEQLEVSAETPSSRKRRHRILEAELNVLRTRREVEMASNALDQLGLMLLRRTPDGERLHRRSLRREQRLIRKHLEARREELAVWERKLDRRRAEAENASGSPEIFRLHSAEHCLGLSAARFARLSRAQLAEPVLALRKDRRRWWWYLDRFWWSDPGLSACDIERLVLRSDFERKLRYDSAEEARASVVGVGPSRKRTSLAESVRLAVWLRDLGRCVDCGSARDVLFDEIIPSTRGGPDAGNVELRCRPCRDRRDDNEARTRVASARVDATPYQRYVA
jgi:hypothetical protein